MYTSDELIKTKAGVFVKAIFSGDMKAASNCCDDVILDYKGRLFLARVGLILHKFSNEILCDGENKKRTIDFFENLKVQSKNLEEMT